MSAIGNITPERYPEPPILQPSSSGFWKFKIMMDLTKIAGSVGLLWYSTGGKVPQSFSPNDYSSTEGFSIGLLVNGLFDLPVNLIKYYSSVHKAAQEKHLQIYTQEIGQVCEKINHALKNGTFLETSPFTDKGINQLFNNSIKVQYNLLQAEASAKRLGKTGLGAALDAEVAPPATTAILEELSAITNQLNSSAEPSTFETSDEGNSAKEILELRAALKTLLEKVATEKDAAAEQVAQAEKAQAAAEKLLAKKSTEADQLRTVNESMTQRLKQLTTGEDASSAATQALQKKLQAQEETKANLEKEIESLTNKLTAATTLHGQIQGVLQKQREEATDAEKNARKEVAKAKEELKKSTETHLRLTTAFTDFLTSVIAYLCGTADALPEIPDSLPKNDPRHDFIEALRLFPAIAERIKTESSQELEALLQVATTLEEIGKYLPFLKVIHPQLDESGISADSSFGMSLPDTPLETIAKEDLPESFETLIVHLNVLIKGLNRKREEPPSSNGLSFASSGVGNMSALSEGSALTDGE